MSVKRHSVLVYCGDVLGLGHQRRNTTIASRLVREMPGTDVVMLTSLPAGFLECPDRVDLIKLPSLRKTAGGGLGARTLGLPNDELKRLRRSIIEGVAAELRPDLVLVDHKPAGVWNELLPSLRNWRAKPDGPCTVFGMRDILDDPVRIVRKWRRSGIYRAIDRYYDSVLVYGSEKVFDTRGRYRFEAETRIPVEYCGYVCPENGLRGKAAVRRELGLGERKVAVVTAGGGTDGFPMMRLCLDALRHAGSTADLEMVCITGPFISREQIDELRRISAALPARVVWWVDQLPAYFEAADLILTMAGYNTLLEVMRVHTPALVLPRKGPSAEQELRAQRLSELGIVRAVRDEERNPERLAALVVECLRTPPPAVGLPELDGLGRTVDRLSELLEARDARLARKTRRGLRSIGGRRR